MTPRRITATITHLDDLHLLVRGHLWETDPAAHTALNRWLEDHGVDPANLPASNFITRDPIAHAISYTEVIRDDDGRAVRDDAGLFVTRETWHQLDDGPAPWPAELWEAAAE